MDAKRGALVAWADGLQEAGRLLEIAEELQATVPAEEAEALRQAGAGLPEIVRQLWSLAAGDEVAKAALKAQHDTVAATLHRLARLKGSTSTRPSER